MGSGRGSGLSCRALDNRNKVFELEADRAILLCLKILLNDGGLLQWPVL